jgi:ADP-ribosyl-[dinitrogen reductase] hydrolase
LQQAEFIRQCPRYRRAQAESPEVSSLRDLRERFLGCLTGLAVGDALSARSQYRPVGGFAAITHLTGGGVFELPAGHWSDDTALSVCIAQSLLESNGFALPDQVQRFALWQRGGQFSAGGYCVGITPGTARLLHRLVPGAPRPALNIADGHDEPAPLARVAPTVMFHFADPIQAVNVAAESAMAFEPTPAVLEACRLLAAMLHSALRGEPLARVLQPRPSMFGSKPLSSEVEALLAHDPTLPPPNGERALTVLAQARCALATSGGFRAGALRVANMGGDSDVIGAVHGQLAGAFYGQASIPTAWLTRVAQADAIEALAGRLFEVSRSSNEPVQAA